MAQQSLPPLDSSVDRAVRAAHGREHVERPAGIKGGFRLSLTTGQWWWSPGMFELHGYHGAQVLSVRPTSRLLLTHRHPADREPFARAWQHLLSDGGVVAFRYRIVGDDDRVRPVFAMAYLDSASGRGGEVTGVMQSDGTA